MHRLVLVCSLVLTVPAVAAAQKITKESLTTGGRQRTYDLFVPDSINGAGVRAPLIVILHGSNRDGRILLDHWQGLARKEGIILAGPDANERAGWHIVPDGPHFLHDLVESLRARYPVDPQRIYLFGHSAGAIHGLHLAVLESEYFAAAAAHAGVFYEEFVQFLDRAPRKIPLAIWIGTNDRFFPLSDVRATRDLLVSRQFPVEFTEIPGHTHDYYGRSGPINKAVWEFLQKHRLPSAPKYQEYEIGK